MRFIVLVVMELLVMERKISRKRNFLEFLAIKTELSLKEVFSRRDLWFKCNGFSC
jgi:hypothetical protein